MMLPRPIQFVATTADMLALDTSGMVQGDLVSLPITAQSAYPRYFMFIEAAVPVDNVTIFPTSNGGDGRWIALEYATGGWRIQTVVSQDGNAVYNVAVPGDYAVITDIGPQAAAIPFTPNTSNLLARGIVSGSAVGACAVTVRIRYNGQTIGIGVQTVPAGASFSIACEGRIQNITPFVELALPITLEWTCTAVTQLSIASISDQQAVLTVQDMYNP